MIFSTSTSQYNRPHHNDIAQCCHLIHNASNHYAGCRSTEDQCVEDSYASCHNAY